MSGFAFALPPELNASAPPERRGLRRDQVRLMLLDRAAGDPVHTRFGQLADYLRPGDLLVLNNSRTLPAVLTAAGPNGLPVEVRLAHRLGTGEWRALLVSPATIRADILLSLPDALEATVTFHSDSEPLSVIRFSREGSALYDTLYRIGQPVRYEYIHERWSLDYYQTVFASVPGSVEMPSAGRAFTWEMLLGLRRKGVAIAFLSLHAGLSYFLDDKWFKDPRYTPEAYHIPIDTAVALAATRRRGGRVIAVGTTVVRTLETAGRHPGEVRPGSGWADIFIDRSFPLRVVDGLLTGLHEPEASHLELLSAFVDPGRLRAAYTEAVAKGYLWHEFGDMNLIL